MRNKSLIVLALIAFGLVGCNKEAPKTEAPVTTDQQQVQVTEGTAASAVVQPEAAKPEAPKA